MATAAAQARWRRRVAEQGRCSTCGRARLNGLKRCAFCLAAALERPLRPQYRHERAEHAWMLILSHAPESRCAASGLTAADLAAIGDQLTVDRIDSDRGYVRGNMQLLSRRLNRMKSRDRHVQPWEIKRLLRLHRGENLGDFL